jgi:NAD(P)-dependent dehydrogenase (short-subunit alcohol dehydrogenase family)
MTEVFRDLSNPNRHSKPVNFSEKYDTASLKDKNVLITGGSTGIGQGCVIGLAEAGAYVTIADVNEKDANETVSNLTKNGHKAQFVKTDVCSWESLVEAFKSAVQFGPEKTLDIVIPAAGIGGIVTKTWLDNPELNEAGDPKPVPTKVVDVNLDGVFYTAHVALYYFKKFPGPKESDKQIIFVSSMAGYSSMTGVAPYCTSKWGVRGLFRSLRGAHRILGDDLPTLRCNLLAPGYVKTPMTRELWEYEEKGLMKMANVSDVVDVVLRICADQDILGRALSVNAGMNYDLGDDPDGLDAGEALSVRRKEYLKRQQQQ